MRLAEYAYGILHDLSPLTFCRSDLRIATFICRSDLRIATVFSRESEFPPTKSDLRSATSSLVGGLFKPDLLHGIF